MKGKLIVFEGGEGSGKTTQIARTQQWLTDLAVPVLVTRQPGGTDLGQELRNILLHQPIYQLDAMAELLLYAADRAQHLAQVIRPELARGTIVLCDRYTDSTIAYQGYGRGLELAAIESLNQLATGGLKPDLTIWLDIDPEVGLNRVKSRVKQNLAEVPSLDRFEQDTLNFHQSVRQGYQQLANAYPKKIKRVDASLGLETVQSEIRLILASILNL